MCARTRTRVFLTVWLFVHVHAHTHKHTHTHTHINTQKFTHSQHTHTHIHTHRYTHIKTYTRTQRDTHTHMHAHTHAPYSLLKHSKNKALTARDLLLKRREHAHKHTRVGARQHVYDTCTHHTFDVNSLQVSSLGPTMARRELYITRILLQTKAGRRTNF